MKDFNSMFENGILRKDHRNFMSHIIDLCIREMYKKAQPSIEYDELIKLHKEGNLEKEYPGGVYNYFYLSTDEFKYILNKYIDVFGLKKTWKPNIDLMIENLKEGGLVDDYIRGENDECGHRIATKLKPISDIIHKKLGIDENLSKQVEELLIETMEGYKDFYMFDRDEDNFSIAVSLGGSPCSNKKTVKNYWKEKGVDITIEDRNPDTFWYKDNGWTDEQIREELENDSFSSKF